MPPFFASMVPHRWIFFKWESSRVSTRESQYSKYEQCDCLQKAFPETWKDFLPKWFKNSFLTKPKKRQTTAVCNIFGGTCFQIVKRQDAILLAPWLAIARYRYVLAQVSSIDSPKLIWHPRTLYYQTFFSGQVHPRPKSGEAAVQGILPWTRNHHTYSGHLGEFYEFDIKVFPPVAGPLETLRGSLFNF